MGVIRFDASGWTARIDNEYDENNVVRIAMAVGTLWASRYLGSTILVGYDGRCDSERLAVVAGQVLSAMGFEAIVSDRVCPTPALAWEAAHRPLCAGALMFTASRMPHTYGGVMVLQGDGSPIDSIFAQAVEQGIQALPTDERGEVTREDFVSGYMASLVNEADDVLIRSADLTVVVDTMHAAGSGYVPQMLESLGCKVIRVHDQMVPDFRGLHPDAREPWVDECERVVVETKADFGVVLDGDCSRFAVVDETGKLVSPHDLAPLVLEHIVRQRGKHGRVVVTEATSARVARQAQRLECDFTMVPVGFESIYREFQEGDVILATDESGSICVPHVAPVRDGILGTLMIVELIAGTALGVRDLVAECEDSIGVMEYVATDIKLDFGATQRLRNILPGINPRDVLGQEPVRVGHAGGLRLELPDGSWVLLRASRSRPVARAYAEAPDAGRAHDLADWAVALARG